jgi:hypothetical protein
MMNSTKRILPIALVAALLGGSVGAFVMRTPKTSAESANNTSTLTPVQAASNPAATETLNLEQSAFRDGFEEGFLAAQEYGVLSADNSAAVQQRSGYTPTYLTRTRRVSNGTAQSRASNHYTRVQPQPQKRSFWQKHRDKLTVAAGAGGGALIGGLIGGKKGALIGGLAGGGGSALYTYKLRKRTPQY